MGAGMRSCLSSGSTPGFSATGTVPALSVAAKIDSGTTTSTLTVELADKFVEAFLADLEANKGKPLIGDPQQ